MQLFVQPGETGLLPTCCWVGLGLGLGPNMTVCMVQGDTRLIFIARERSQVFGWGAWWAAVYGVTQSRT